MAREEMASHHALAVAGRAARGGAWRIPAQMLHVGAQAHIPETMVHIRAFGSARGLLPRPEAYEIYLNDPVTTRPENMRTIPRRGALGLLN